MCCNVFNVWPKTTLLSVWRRDAKVLDTPVPCARAPGLVLKTNSCYQLEFPVINDRQHGWVHWDSACSLATLPNQADPPTSPECAHTHEHMQIFLAFFKIL